MPEGCVRKVMAELTSWQKVEVELNKVISSSQLGKRLFHFAIQQLLSQMVSSRINTALDELWQKEITLACVREVKRTILDALA